MVALPPEQLEAFVIRDAVVAACAVHDLPDELHLPSWRHLGRRLALQVEDDKQALREARRAKVPVVAVQTGTETHDVPYVLATDVVACRPGAGFPVEEIAATVAARLGEAGTALAARLPVLREPVCEGLVDRFSRQNGVIGAAFFIPGADFAVLTLNQIRLVLRLAAAHGVEIDQSRLPEVLATVGAGLGFRALARQVLGVVPVAGWVVKGGIAYAGTRALGEAAQRYFAAQAKVEPQR